MNKVLIFAACFLLVFTSCKKNSNVAPANTFSADIDGVQESFKTNLFAQLGNGVTFKSSLSIFGANGGNASADMLTITLNTNKTIVPGTYISGNDNVGFVSIEYNDGPVSVINPHTYATDINGSPTTVVITSVTNTNIQGTFSGIIVEGSASKAVTNGKFNVAIK